MGMKDEVQKRNPVLQDYTLVTETGEGLPCGSRIENPGRIQKQDKERA